MDGQLDEWMDGWMEGQMDGWMKVDGWMDRRTYWMQPASGGSFEQRLWGWMEARGHWATGNPLG